MPDFVSLGIIGVDIWARAVGQRPKREWKPEDMVRFTNAVGGLATSVLSTTRGMQLSRRRSTSSREKGAAGDCRTLVWGCHAHEVAA